MKYIVAVDQSTSASKVFLVNERGEITRAVKHAHRQLYPTPGRAEHDAEEIYQCVLAGINEVIDGVERTQIDAIALTNQRETIVVWERVTGQPICPAIVWQDTRGDRVCAEQASANDRVRQLTGSAISPYLPASKAEQLLREQPSLRERAQNGELCIGTIESYLIFRLCGRFVSDYSNASRTQWLDLHTRDWSSELLSLFGMPRAALAETLLPSDACFGEYCGIPIIGVLGDSFAALFGQGCHAPGTAKATYGTGASVMVNTGDVPLVTGNGLTAAIAYGYRGHVCYEIEGNITCSGDTLIWLRDGLKLFSSLEELEQLAGSVPDAKGVQLVPAFEGLGAPFFDVQAKATLRGMTRGTTRAHVARAALESIAQRVTDVTEAIRAESGFTIPLLMADGGGSRNELLMQTQANLANCELRCADASDLSALGAAYMAGLTTGLYASFEELAARRQTRIFAPHMQAEARLCMRRDWAQAIQSARL